MTPKMRIIPTGEKATVGDARHYPGSRLLIVCSLCGWSKSYWPERVVQRLMVLKTGGGATTLAQVARRVAWPCPGCGRVHWRAALAWPLGFNESDARRLANQRR